MINFHRLMSLCLIVFGCGGVWALALQFLLKL